MQPLQIIRRLFRLSDQAHPSDSTVIPSSHASEKRLVEGVNLEHEVF